MIGFWNYLVGDVIVLAFCCFLFYKRTKFEFSALSTVPLMTTAFWTFVYFPFMTIIPVIGVFNEGNIEEVSRL
jgi:hypothetical protein